MVHFRLLWDRSGDPPDAHLAILQHAHSCQQCFQLIQTSIQLCTKFSCYILFVCARELVETFVILQMHRRPERGLSFMLLSPVLKCSAVSPHCAFILLDLSKRSASADDFQPVLHFTHAEIKYHKFTSCDRRCQTPFCQTAAALLPVAYCNKMY